MARTQLGQRQRLSRFSPQQVDGEKGGELLVWCASAGWVKRRSTTSVGIPHKGRNGRPPRQKQLDGGGRRRVQARGVLTVYTKVTNGRLVSRFSLGVRSGGHWRSSTPPTTLVAGVTYLGRVAAPWLRHGRRASKWSVENGSKPQAGYVKISTATPPLAKAGDLRPPTAPDR